MVKVGKPSRFTPSEYAVTGKAPAYVALTVTLINGTGKRFDAALLSASMQSNDTEADQVFDSENGLGGAPSTALLPNRQSSFKIGFAVQNPKDLVLELTPGFEYSPAVFVS